MCSYNITLDDTIVEKVRPAFPDDQALTLWLQQQMEEHLLHYQLRQAPLPNNSIDEQTIPDVVLSLLGAGLPLDDNDLNGRNAHYQFLEEKHKYSALLAQAEAIITRNGKDFTNSTLPVMTAKEYLES